MLVYNARNKNQGFTLIETLVILIIIGILSAIAAPSFLALSNKNKIDDAVSKIRGALQEAQRESIRKSQSCTVTLDTANKKIASSCLVTGTRPLPNGVAMQTNISGQQINFGIRGNTTFTPDTGKIILYSSDGSTSNMKCVAISSGIGIIRAGRYSGPINSVANITSGNCNAFQ